MAHYDRLDSVAQALERARWSRAFDDRAAALDLQAEFEAERSSYSELDADGNVVTHYPGT